MLAKAVYQSTHSLPDPPPSRASPLPHWGLCWVTGFSVVPDSHLTLTCPQAPSRVESPSTKFAQRFSMKALPWLYLALLTLGYGLALSYGQLGWLALTSGGLLLIAGFAVRQQHVPFARYLGHGLFIVLALALALHWLPVFYNGRAIDPQRFTDNAVPFSMYLNQDKPLIGFWLLLICPWIVMRRSLRLTVYATALAAIWRQPRPVTGLIAVRTGPCGCGLDLGVAGRAGGGRLWSGLPFWRTRCGDRHTLRAEPAAFRPVHLSNAGRLKQGPFCDAVLITERKIQ